MKFKSWPVTIGNKIDKWTGRNSRTMEFMRKCTERHEQGIEDFLRLHKDFIYRTFYIGKGKLVFLERGIQHPSLSVKLLSRKVREFKFADLQSAETVLSHHIKIDKDDIFQQCIKITRKAVRETLADGILYTRNGGYKITPYEGHAVCYKKYDDGFLAIDLTAGFNTDALRGNLDVICLYANTFKELKELLSDLYSGDWVEIK